MTMTGNDRGIWPNIIKPLHLYIIRWSGSSLHAARYAERGGDGRQDADGYLNHYFPSFFLSSSTFLIDSTIGVGWS